MSSGDGVKVAKVKLPYGGKSDHQNVPLRSMVEVCGFGVPLPRSNLLAARISKMLQRL
jgi:hypothetical protein